MKKNDSESIISKLLNRKVSDWPSLWKNLEEDTINISPHKEEQILSLIRNSEEKYKREKPTFQFNFFQKSFAFSIIIIIFILTFYIFQSNPQKQNQLRLLSTNGNPIIQRGNEKIQLTKNFEFADGDILITSVNQRIVFSLSRGLDIVYFVVKQNSNLKITKLDLTKLTLYLETLNSNLIVYSEKKIEKDVKIISNQTEFKMSGTIAQLILNQNKNSLKLLEGAFQVSKLNSSINLNSNQEIEFKENDSLNQNSVQSLKDISKKELVSELEEIKTTDQVLKNSIEKYFQKNDLISNEKIYLSLDTIKLEYGSIQEVILKDGTNLKGHLIIEEDEPYILVTLDKKIKLKKEEISEINDLE